MITYLMIMILYVKNTLSFNFVIYKAKMDNVHIQSLAGWHRAKNSNKGKGEAVRTLKLEVVIATFLPARSTYT